MDTDSGKFLDEACNSYNERYSDEVLYAAWTEAPRIEAVPDTPVPIEAAKVDIDDFMARLYANQR